jgi:hypothetical protein
MGPDPSWFVGSFALVKFVLLRKPKSLVGELVEIKKLAPWDTKN